MPSCLDKPWRTRAAGAAVVAVLVVLAACGGGSDGEVQSIDEQIGLDEEGVLQRQVQAQGYNYAEETFRDENADLLDRIPEA